MALQHLRSSTADKRPTPAAMSDGQLAMNTNTASPGLFFKDSNGDSIKAGPAHVGTTAPNATPGAGGQAGNSKGELWLDTTGGTYVLKTWDGTAWRSVSLTGDFVETTGDTMTGALVMDDQGQVRFRETTANGTSYVALQAAASVASNKTITLPDATGTVVLSGAIVNADINASAAIADTKLGTISTAGKVSNSATTAASANTPSAIVARDGSGNFTAGTITAALTGNAATATNLSSNRTFALTGDVTGSVSSNLSSGMSISANVAAAGLVASAAKAVGSYALARNSTGGSLANNATAAGSSLFVSYANDGGVWATRGTTFSGTWRNMSGAALANSEHGIFQRIS
jgi:hypothetical protein